jgi:AbrB family looped-hinge helix DNA binding protein
MMVTATITSKGQITIPSSVRAALNLDVGSKVEFVENADGSFTFLPLNQNVQSLKGVLQAPKQPVSIDDINEAIAKLGMLSK